MIQALWYANFEEMDHWTLLSKRRMTARHAIRRAKQVARAKWGDDWRKEIGLDPSLPGYVPLTLIEATTREVDPPDAHGIIFDWFRLNDLNFEVGGEDLGDPVEVDLAASESLQRVINRWFKANRHRIPKPLRFLETIQEIEIP